MKIFLTGGSGFIGSSFINIALKKKYFINALSRKERIKKKNLNWLKGDLDGNWSAYLKESDILVHIAAAGVNKNKISKKKIFDVNVTKSLVLIKSALKNGVDKFLIISTSSEYGQISNRLSPINKNQNRNPKNNYASSKVVFINKIKKLAKKNNCKFRIMRLFPIYGNGESKHRLYPSIIKAAKKGSNFVVNNPSELRDFTHIKLTSKILIDACKFKKKTKKFEIFHVSSNKPMTVKNFVIKFWKKFKAKGRLIFKNEKKIFSEHLSDIKSTWKLKK